MATVYTVVINTLGLQIKMII